MSRIRIVRAFVVARWFRRFRTRAAVERHQRRKLRRHLAFVRSRSAWFRDASDPLPAMDKRIMMANFDEMNTVGVRLADALPAAIEAERARTFDAASGDVAIGLSSGTSGRRGVFLVDAAERDGWAGTMLAKTLPRGRILGHRIALFLRADSALYETVASRAVRFRYFDILQDPATAADELARYAPTILVGPASVLRGIAAHRPAIAPTRVYAVAEVLHDDDAAAIRSAFGVGVVDQLYQCTEGFIAASCEFGTLHLNEELVIVEREYLDERRFVPIVTDVSRTSQPIIRYRLDDVLVLRDEPCPCGSVMTALARIEGREGDVLRFGDRPVFADAVTRAFAYAEGFDEYRLVQTGPTSVEVQLDRLDAQVSVGRELAALWQRAGVPEPTTTFRSFVAEPGAKVRRVTRTRREDESDATH